MKMRRLKYLLFMLVALIVSGVVVMLLWNALLPSIFKLTRINFWQALGLLVLSKIFFGGFGGNRMREMRAGHDRRNHFREKWAKMQPGEREEFIKRFHVRQHDSTHRHFTRHPFFNEPDEPAKE